MTPIFFDGRFGWLHDDGAALADGAPRLGVVLCPAFAQEEICTHYGMMLLADRLAAAGLPTLRFDYRGTGDSADVEVTLDSLREDVVRAADCLRQEKGVGAVALCGIRLGAAVAALAAGGTDGVSGVAMLAPVIDGRAFLRETRAAASVAPLAQLDPVPRMGADAAMNTNGFRWSATLQREVAAIGLSHVAPPAERILLASTRHDRRATGYAASLRQAGGDVAEHPFADYDAFIMDPTVNVVPEATFAAVADWLAALPRTGDVFPVTQPVAIEPMLTVANGRETPLLFGPGGRVFGMLCEPHGAAPAPIAALLLHEGSSHHIGNGRAYVRLARRLAADGIASLRMDLTGTGDSQAGGNDRSPYFDPERVGEAVAAIDLLDGDDGRKVVALGLCSGAHLALQVALADERVAGTCLINLPKFLWRYGDDIRVVARESKRSVRSYLRSMRSVATYRRVLRGQADLAGIVRVLARRAATGTIEAIRALKAPSPGSDRAVVRDQMRRLAERGVDMLMLFSDDDVGLADMTRYFGRAGRGLRAFAPSRMIRLPRADHHFNAAGARERHIVLVETSLRNMTATMGTRRA